MKDGGDWQVLDGLWWIRLSSTVGRSPPEPRLAGITSDPPQHVTRKAVGACPSTTLRVTINSRTGRNPFGDELRTERRRGRRRHLQFVPVDVNRRRA